MEKVSPKLFTTRIISFVLVKTIYSMNFSPNSTLRLIKVKKIASLDELFLKEGCATSFGLTNMCFVNVCNKRHSKKKNRERENGWKEH